MDGGNVESEHVCHRFWFRSEGKYLCIAVTMGMLNLSSVSPIKPLWICNVHNVAREKSQETCSSCQDEWRLLESDNA